MDHAGHTSFLHTSAVGAFFAFLAFAVLYPNSFGNNPDLIQDESYFLTSSLSAIEKHTLPGWEFSASGAYYGGPQTYLDTLALVPVIGIAVGEAHFSLTTAEVWLAFHTGDLLQVLRVVNGLIVLAAVALLYRFFRRKHIPRELGVELLLVLFLILGNTLVIGTIHTAKVWTLSFAIDAVLGALFLAQEYYLARRDERLISTSSYASILVWGCVLAFFQNFIGVYSALLWVAYALILRHLSFSDLFAVVKKQWYLIALFAATQISFVYRGLILRDHPSLLDPAGNSTRTATAGIDWFHRLVDPVRYALQSEPLILLYLIGLVVAVFAARRVHTARTRWYFVIACVHPVLVLLFYQGLIGFSLFPRYSIMFAMACSFSIALLLRETRILMYVAAAISGVLFFIVSAQAIHLYWHPSSAKELSTTLETHFNDAQNVFIIDPTASRLSLPLNGTSLAELDARRKSLTRFQFLLNHPDEAAKETSFLPTVIFADTAAEETAARADFPDRPIWTVSQDCTHLSTEEETAAGGCFVVNQNACALFDEQGQKEYPLDALVPYLRESQLGIGYIVREVR